jgi:hypothetical protein
MRELRAGGDEAQEASQAAIASYIADMVAGLRYLSTKKEGLRFLDQLLALAEQEAKTMSSHTYN